MRRAMDATMQFPGVSMTDHGRQVLSCYEKLVGFLSQEPQATDRSMRSGDANQEEPAPFPRLPAWAAQHRRLLCAMQPSPEVMREYLLLHDCGKPFCRTQDQEGRMHYPGHAGVSAEVYRRALGKSEEVESLIERDMLIHTISADDLPSFALSPGAAGLLLAGLAEVYANSEMFGGTDSNGFKIKMKHLERRGRRLVAIWSGLKGGG